MPDQNCPFRHRLNAITEQLHDQHADCHRVQQLSVLSAQAEALLDNNQHRF